MLSIELFVYQRGKLLKGIETGGSRIYKFVYNPSWSAGESESKSSRITDGGDPDQIFKSKACRTADTWQRVRIYPDWSLRDAP